MINTKKLEALVLAVLALLLQAWLFKELINWLGPEQGIRPITWIQALGWLVTARLFFGTGEILSRIRGANREKG